MDSYLEKAKQLYEINDHDLREVSGQDRGRNLVYICHRNGEPEFVLRLSMPGDRKAQDYLAAAEFVRYLAENHAPVADVIPSINGNDVESFVQDGKEIFVMLFAYAKGMLISENGYRYREGVPLEEYFYNTGKALGVIHRLSKECKPLHRRQDFFDRYDRDHIEALLPDSYVGLKQAIFERLEEFKSLSRNRDDYGLVHFDFNDGNYHIDMNTGEITVFDFDNCIYCWYLFDLAHLWINGTGWCRQEEDPCKRKKFMDHYFATVLAGYRSENLVSEEMLEKLPLFIDMVLIESITDAFECSLREGNEPDREDIGSEEYVLMHDIPYTGFC